MSVEQLDRLMTGQSILCPECGAELQGPGGRIPPGAMAVCSGCAQILIACGGPWAELMTPIKVPPSRYAEYSKLERAAAEIRRARSRVELVG